MRRYSLCLAVIVIAMLLFASCNPCKRGGSGGECPDSMELYLLNSSSVKIQLGDNVVLNSGERKFLTILDSRMYFPHGYFGDTVSIIFNDSILFKHIEINNHGVIEYIPSEHNILDYFAWEVDFIDDSYERWGVYTITEEDYQRVLEQNEK